MLTALLERKRREATMLAVLSIAAVAAVRFSVESRGFFAAEMLGIFACFLASLVRIPTRSRVPTESIARLATIATPPIFAIVARAYGSPIPYEMTALTTFGAVALALSIGSDRTRAMSLVASGFLTLFAVAISENPSAVWIAIVWMTMCVWHLIANHWTRLEQCSVEGVRRSAGVRPASVVMAVAICVLSGWAVRDRFGDSNRLAFGLMPSSGGTRWSDPAARSGVGSGDAAIEAKDHAESFGAVESELFLESTESTLFDMFSDSLGEPKKKPKWERRQGMAADQVLESHNDTATSERGGRSFSADRMPAEKHLHLGDAVENAVIQWAGPSGIRLAMNRYDTFDGFDWTNEAKHRNEKLIPRRISGAAWFCDPAAGALEKSSTQVNLLKVLRLDSTRLPVPMMTSALHIKDIDRQDFFAIDDDGSYFMPGRERVPQLTVVNVASSKIIEDELWSGLQIRSPSRSTQRIGDRASRRTQRPDSVATVSDPAAGETTHDHRPEMLATYAARWTVGIEQPYEKLQAIVSHLRDEFTFDRSSVPESGKTTVDDPSLTESTGPISSSGPISEFLRTRRGGDHLFATTAALMAREIGLQSRLVTGFYVRPSAIDIAARHTNVLPEDVHVWAEIRLDDGRWFEIEPTPGYQPPVYTPSTWLVAKRFAAAHWPSALVLLAIVGVMLVTRLFWIELGLSILYPVGAIVWPRGRMTLAMHVLQMRAKYAGCPRIAGRPQRDWLLAITSNHDQLRDSARQFCDAADRAAFAGDQRRFQEHTVPKELMTNLKIRVLRQLTTEATA